MGPGTLHRLLGISLTPCRSVRTSRPSRYTPRYSYIALHEPDSAAYIALEKFDLIGLERPWSTSKTSENFPDAPGIREALQA